MEQIFRFGHLAGVITRSHPALPIAARQAKHSDYQSLAYTLQCRNVYVVCLIETVCEQRHACTAMLGWVWGAFILPQCWLNSWESGENISRSLLVHFKQSFLSVRYSLHWRQGSTNVERLFSTASLISDGRPRQLPENLEKLLSLKMKTIVIDW